MWDRFHWGPKDTDGLSQAAMRHLFIVLEQQCASKDAAENLGPPSEARMQAKAKAKMSAAEDYGAKRIGKVDE